MNETAALVVPPALSTSPSTTIFGLVMASFVTVLLLRRLPQWWRNDRGLHADSVPGGWPWGKGMWRSYVRLLPGCALFFILGVPAVILTDLTAEGSILNGIGVAVGTLAFVESVVALVGVPLFNRPKFLVAPHLRDQPGLIAEFRGEKPIPTPPPRLSPRQQRGHEAAEPRPRLSWLPDDLRERHEREFEGASHEDDGEPRSERRVPR